MVVEGARYDLPTDVISSTIGHVIFRAARYIESVQIHLSMVLHSHN